MNNSKTGPILITTIIIMVLCVLLLCCCLAALGVLAAVRSAENIDIDNPITNIFEITPTPEITPNPDNINLDVEQLTEAQDTLDNLNALIVPINDPIDLAERLAGKLNVPSQLIDEDAPLYIRGETKSADIDLGYQPGRCG